MTYGNGIIHPSHTHLRGFGRLEGVGQAVRGHHQADCWGLIGDRDLGPGGNRQDQGGGSLGAGVGLDILQGRLAGRGRAR